MGARNVKPTEAKTLKTKTANAQQKTALPKSSKTQRRPAVNDTMGEQERDENSITPQETDHDQIPSSKNHGEYQIPPLDTEEDQIPPNEKKRSNKRRASQEPYANVSALDDAEEITFFKKRNYRVARTFWLSSARTLPINCVFDIGVGASLLRADWVEPD